MLEIETGALHMPGKLYPQPLELHFFFFSGEERLSNLAKPDSRKWQSEDFCLFLFDVTLLPCLLALAQEWC